MCYSRKTIWNFPKVLAQLMNEFSFWSPSVPRIFFHKTLGCKTVLKCTCMPYTVMYTRILPDWNHEATPLRMLSTFCIFSWRSMDCPRNYLAQCCLQLHTASPLIVLLKNHIQYVMYMYIAKSSKWKCFAGEFSKY